MQFDKNHNVIKTQSIDLESDDYIDYQAEEDCEYIFIEEDYEVMDDENDEQQANKKYTERYFFNNSTKSIRHQFKAPLGNGFVRTIPLGIKFWSK